jgi:hypothetical protein
VERGLKGRRDAGRGFFGSSAESTQQPARRAGRDSSRTASHPAAVDVAGEWAVRVGLPAPGDGGPWSALDDRARLGSGGAHRRALRTPRCAPPETPLAREGRPEPPGAVVVGGDGGGWGGEGWAARSGVAGAGTPRFAWRRISGPTVDGRGASACSACGGSCLVWSRSGEPESGADNPESWGSDSPHPTLALQRRAGQPVPNRNAQTLPGTQSAAEALEVVSAIRQPRNSRIRPTRTAFCSRIAIHRIGISARSGLKTASVILVRAN